MRGSFLLYTQMIIKSLHDYQQQQRTGVIKRIRTVLHVVLFLWFHFPNVILITFQVLHVWSPADPMKPLLPSLYKQEIRNALAKKKQ